MTEELKPRKKVVGYSLKRGQRDKETESTNSRKGRWYRNFDAAFGTIFSSSSNFS
jgi:hypothetical protein